MTRTRPLIALVLLLACLSAAVAGTALAQDPAPAPAPAPPTAAQLTWGLGEQSPGIFNDPRWKALPLLHMRYFVPWDLRAEPRYRRLADVWLHTARRHHAIVLLALTQSDRFGHTHDLPSLKVYRRAVRWIMRRYRSVHEFTPWNEANLLTQATLRHPRIAADYWRVMSGLCRHCTVTSPSLVGYRLAPRRWLARFMSAAHGLHGPWALHIYNDVNEFSTRTLSSFQSVLHGPIWVTEVAGWKHFRGFPASLLHQTKAVRYLFAEAPLFPRVERWYLYQWLGSGPGKVWDSGLLNQNGSARPALHVVEHYLLGTVPLPGI